MQQTKETPTFNMKAVVQETSLKPDTIRAWERRYDLPQPERTEGGHRLYSRRDIDTLKWLIERQDEGLSISYAVELWKRFLSEGKDPLTEKPGQPERLGTVVSQPSVSSGTKLTELQQTWIEAALAFDEPGAEAVLNQAFALYSPEAVCIELLQQGLTEIGRSWYEGTTTVQQEHFASSLAHRRLETLIAATPRPTRTERILIGCPPQEEHTLSALLITLLMRRRGWDVIYLGANVPTDRLAATARTTRPQLAIFPAQLLYTVAALPEMAQMLAAENISLAFGGRIFTELPALKDHITGFYLGNEVKTAIQVLEGALLNRQLPPKTKPLSGVYVQALNQFQRQEASIELSAREILGESSVPYTHFVDDNLQLTRNIIAALKLGNMNFLRTELSWVEGLLNNNGLDPNLLPDYLNAYFQAATRHLDSRAGPVLDWLSQFETN